MIHLFIYIENIPVELHILIVFGGKEIHNSLVVVHSQFYIVLEYYTITQLS